MRRGNILPLPIQLIDLNPIDKWAKAHHIDQGAQQDLMFDLTGDFSFQVNRTLAAWEFKLFLF